MLVTSRVPVRAKRLATRLRVLRERAGLTHEDLVPHVDHQQAWCSKVERCAVRIRVPEVVAWVTACGLKAGDTEFETLTTLARDARRKDLGWLDTYRTGDDSAILDYVEWEATASSYSTIEDCFIPGLLQTPDYAYAIERATSCMSDAEIAQVVEIREKRQRRLIESDPIEVCAILGQEAVDRPIGGSRVMLDQLAHLVNVANLSHVTVQIVPRDTGAYPGMGGRFALLGFRDQPGLDVAYLETPVGGFCVESEETIQVLSRQMRLAHAVALSPSASIDALDRKIKEIEAQHDRRDDMA